jgi:PAS domain S-box-containing protein
MAQNDWQTRFQLLESSLRDYAVFTIDASGIVASWNPGVEQVLGYGREDFVGLPFATLFTPEDRAMQRPAEELARAAATGRSDDKRFHVRRDGTRFPADGVVRAIPGDVPGAISFLKLMYDATHQRRTSEALRHSEEQYRLLVENLRDYAVFLLDAEGHVASWTAEAQKMKGYAAQDIIGRHFRVFFTPEDQERGQPERELETAVNAGRAEGEGWRVRQDGSRFWGDEIVAPIRHADGELRGFAKIVRDLTARQLAAIEQQQLYAQAHEANRLKDEFLGMVSHELRTPLNAIVGWTHLLELTTSTMDDTQRRALRAITRNAQIQVQLVDDLLDVSRIVSGQVRLQMETTPLGDVVRGAIDSVRPSASAKRLQLESHIDPADALVYADRDRLQQIIWNLLSNAIKFTPAEGRVSLWAGSSEGRTEIVVSDDGIGIEPDVLPFVFERFRQADSSTTRRHGGVGLGLAIVRHLTEQHGGTIEAGSAGPGAGATFTVRLPGLPHAAHAVSASPTPVREPVAALPALDHVRVLVVDDDEDAREVLRTALTHVGADVIVAQSASTALEHIASRPPEVIIADIGMPDEDGYSLIRKLRQAPGDLGGKAPAIALTSFARAEDRKRALDAGFQMHLSKPIVPSAVVHAVAQLVTAGHADR